MSKKKVIITIAPTGGVAFKQQSRYLPTQPAEIARDTYDRLRSGAGRTPARLVWNWPTPRVVR